MEGIREQNDENQEPPNKQRKLINPRKSALSKYFDFYWDQDDTKNAICKACLKVSQVEKIIKMKNSNTTAARDHLQKVHPQDFEELSSTSRSHSQIAQFQGPSSQNEFETMLCDWLAKKYLPFSFFDDEETEKIFSYLNPKARVLKRTEMRRKVIERFNYLQKGVMKILKDNDSKISFTIDAWTSIANKSYFGITAHFIDKKWDMHSLVVDFTASNGEHTGRAIANNFYRTIESYNLEDKFQGVTVDNASANTTFVVELSKILNERGDHFNANDKQFRCFAHILNLAVQDMLKILKITNEICEEDDSTDSHGDEMDTNENSESDDFELEGSSTSDSENTCALQKLRSLFKKIRNSEQWQIKLKACCDTKNIAMLSLNVDVCTRWNSTHDMVKTALKMKQAFNLLCLNNKEVSNFNLSESEWQILSRIVRFLRDFKLLSETLGGEKYVTLPQVVIGFNMLLDKIERTIFELDAHPDITDVDETFLKALVACRDKIVKHYDKMNWIYCVALILDPRHKTETFDLTDWGKKMKKKSIQEFKGIYGAKYCPTSTNHNSSPKNLSNDDNSDDDTLDLNSLFKKQDSSPNNNELNGYTTSERADANTNPLAWWKLYERQYPNLARMARDILSTPATSVPAERLFSKASLTIRKHRNRLTHESAKSLLCLNSWITCSLREQIKSEARNCQ